MDPTGEEPILSIVASWRRWLMHPGVQFAIAWAGLLAVLFAPLLAGGVIVNPYSDAKDGYVTRHFAAEVIRTWGEIPRWDPYIFGGLPFLGAVHGDQAYPVSIALRALFPAALGIGLGMVLHLWLGAVGMLMFLRRLRHTWSAAIVGATAYGLGGPLIGLLFPGHDGKIFVLGLLPWGLTAILEAARTARPAFFAMWGTVLGLMLLSPHFQMTYYFCLLALAFGVLTLTTETPPGRRWRVVAGMAAGSVFGFLLAGAQVIPFLQYLPFSARGAAGTPATAWAYATNFSLPGLELIGTVWGGFNGWLGTYWGTNPFKLHSDYVGLLVGLLALTSLWGVPAGPQRRMIRFWAIAVLVGTLWALGGHTPFYRLPYTLLPGIAKTRAPGMIWGLVSAGIAVLVAYGFARVHAMEAEARKRWAIRTGVIVAAAGVLLALASSSLIPALAQPERRGAALAAVSGAQWGLLLGAFTVVAFALVAWRAPRAMAAAAVGLIALDLVIQDHRFMVIDPRGDRLFAADAVVQAIQTDAAHTVQPWRVYPALLPGQPYLDDYLIEHRIRSVLGYHGNELQRYDELLGGKGQWTRLANPRLWRLLAIRYILTPSPITFPGLDSIGGPLTTWLGETAWVYRLADPAPWAWVVPVAVRVEDAQAEQLAVAPQFPPLSAALVPPDAPFATTPVPTEIPPPINPAPSIRVEERQPGVYVLDIAGLARDAVLVVSENWMPDWTARVDGQPASVARANGTFLAVPLSAGSREVVLTLEARADRLGRRVSAAGLGGVAALLLLGVRRRRRPA